MRIDVHAHMTPETCVEITPDDRNGETYTLRFTDERTGDVLYTTQQRATNWGRWEHSWRVREDTKRRIDRPPSEYFRLLYFDTLTHSGPALNYLVETVGPERLMLGSDYPYDMSDTDPVRAIAAVPGLTDAQRELMYGGNAMALFRIEASLPGSVRPPVASR